MQGVGSARKLPVCEKHEISIFSVAHNRFKDTHVFLEYGFCIIFKRAYCKRVGSRVHKIIVPIITPCSTEPIISEMIVIVRSGGVVDIHLNVEIECYIGKHLIVKKIFITFPYIGDYRREFHFIYRSGIWHRHFRHCTAVCRTLRHDADFIPFFGEVVTSHNPLVGKYGNTCIGHFMVALAFLVIEHPCVRYLDFYRFTGCNQRVQT